MTWRPEVHCYTWKPRGGLRGKTLAELIAELRELPIQIEWSKLRCLLIRLETHKSAVHVEVPHEEEARCESLKKHLDRFLRACIANAPHEEVFVSINIELMTTLDSLTRSAKLEDIDLDW
ncbi:hypothetical protein BDP55DRAFT_637762 [Colletotrichum godetiae]|uniref:Uncharacterized protein n=1 Tax=Colletotrichum godetiae TaxID=1209918 RepID=A0AAJ0ABG3_9PEZI|nr:uncharacterized protein BDP55DRAFT_637762 [Colletotrichum godetiae]KAK1658537.1 hypothetical protein BDP55DRAFT_637762 [Colletotrichum godetiae]